VVRGNSINLTFDLISNTGLYLPIRRSSRTTLAIKLSPQGAQGIHASCGWRMHIPVNLRHKHVGVMVLLVGYFTIIVVTTPTIHRCLFTPLRVRNTHHLPSVNDMFGNPSPTPTLHPLRLHPDTRCRVGAPTLHPLRLHPDTRCRVGSTMQLLVSWRKWRERMHITLQKNPD